MSVEDGADTHHVVILTWDGTRPRKRHSPHLHTATYQVQQVTERDRARLRVGQADPQRPVQRGGRHRLGGDGERALSRQASVGRV